jgi:hypothetical protein
MPNRKTVTPTRHITPSAAVQQTDKLVQDMEALRNWFRNRIMNAAPLIVYAPSTPSTQAAGVGNTVWNANLLAFEGVVDAHAGNIAATTDGSIHAASLLSGFVNGNSCVAACILYWSGTALGLCYAKGTPAVTGSQASPTIAQCQAAADAASALGAGVTLWIKIGETTLNRTGDATVTQTYDNTARPLLAVNEDTTFGDWSSIASF